MDPHRIKVLDRTDDDAVVRLVAHHFHLELFPAEQGFLNQQFVCWRRFQTTLADGFELFHVVSDTTTGPPQGEGRTDDGRKTNHRLHLIGFFHAVGSRRTRRAKTDLGHGVLEFLPVLGLVDGFLGSADQLDTELGQHAFAVKVERAVERGLTAHGRQQRIRTLFLDDLGDDLPSNWLDIGHVGHFRVGHDGRRIGIHQDDLVALLAQCLAGLSTGVVEFTGLADDDRTGANDQDALNVCTFRHFLLEGICEGYGIAPASSRHPLRISINIRWLLIPGADRSHPAPAPSIFSQSAATPRVMQSRKRSNRWATSCGPGMASGCPWKEKAGTSVRAIP